MAEAKKKSDLHTNEAGFDWAARTVDIANEGTKIILPASPANMSLTEGIDVLKRAEKDANMEYAISEEIGGHFFDGCVALFAVMKDIYGYVGSQPKQTWFGDIPPRLLHIKVGPKE